MNDGYVSISAEKLKDVCMQCLKNRVDYNGEDDVVIVENVIPYFGGVFKKKPVKYTKTPLWTYKNCGIDTKLNDFISIVDNVLNDTTISDKDIKLSLTMYSELFKLLNKDKDFQPYVFGR